MTSQPAHARAAAQNPGVKGQADPSALVRTRPGASVFSTPPPEWGVRGAKHPLERGSRDNYQFLRYWLANYRHRAGWRCPIDATRRPARCPNPLFPSLNKGGIGIEETRHVLCLPKPPYPLDLACMVGLGRAMASHQASYEGRGGVARDRGHDESSEGRGDPRGPHGSSDSTPTPRPVAALVCN